MNEEEEYSYEYVTDDEMDQEEKVHSEDEQEMDKMIEKKVEGKVSISIVVEKEKVADDTVSQSEAQKLFPSAKILHTRKGPPIPFYQKPFFEKNFSLIKRRAVRKGKNGKTYFGSESSSDNEVEMERKRKLKKQRQSQKEEERERRHIESLKPKTYEFYAFDIYDGLEDVRFFLSHKTKTLTDDWKIELVSEQIGMFQFTRELQWGFSDIKRCVIFKNKETTSEESEKFRFVITV